MNMRFGLVAVLAAILSSQLIWAAEFEKDGLKYIGKDEAVAVFAAASKTHDEAKLRFEAMQKSGGAAVQQNNQVTGEWVNARDAMYEASIVLKMVPTGKPGPDFYMFREYLEARWKESSWDPKGYATWLKELLPAWRNYPGEATILLKLADLNKENPELAMDYLQQATRCQCYSGPWKYEQQHAWQEIAKIHEQRKDYAKAIAALGNWKIQEQCGNGRAGSMVKKSFWLWRLRLLNGEKPEVVRAEAWEMGDDCNGPLGTINGLIALYGKDGEALKKDAQRLLADQPKEPMTDVEKYRVKGRRSVAEGVLKILADEAALANLSDDELMMAMQVQHNRMKDYRGRSAGVEDLYRIYKERSQEAIQWRGPVNEARKRQPRLAGKLQNEWLQFKDPLALLTLTLDPVPENLSALCVIMNQTENATEGQIAMLLTGDPGARRNIISRKQYTPPSAEARMDAVLKETSPLSH
jgi:hypothetical protein